MIRRIFSWAPWGILALVLVGGVWNTVANGSDTTPLPKDVQAANQILDAPGEGRAPIPPVGSVGAPGVVEPRERAASLSTQVGGVVAEILVSEGQTVEDGAPLLRLVDEVERAAVLQAEAELMAQDQQLERARGAGAREVEAAARDAEAAAARAALSEKQLARVRQLAATSSVTPDEVDRAAAAANADAQAAAAAAARWEARRDGRAADIAVAKAQVASAAARLEQAKAAVAQRLVRAPEAGEVLQIAVRRGEYVSPGVAAIVMGDTSTIRVRLDVDERDVHRVSVGQRGYVVADGFPGQLPATVVEVSRRMGRKNVRTDDPTERIDTKILEVLVEVEGAEALPQGLRVSGYLGGV